MKIYINNITKEMEKNIYFIAHKGTAITNPYFSKDELLKDYDFDPAAGDELVEVKPGDQGYDELAATI